MCWRMFFAGVLRGGRGCLGRRHPRTRRPYGEDAGTEVEPAAPYADCPPHEASASPKGLPSSTSAGVNGSDTDRQPVDLDYDGAVSRSPVDAPVEGSASSVEPMPSPPSAVMEPRPVPAVAPHPLRAYDARFAYPAVCACAENRSVHDAVQRLVGAVRETAAIVTLFHSKESIEHQCALLGRLFELDGFLWWVAAYDDLERVHLWSLWL